MHLSSIADGVRWLANNRPEIFTADHVAYLKTWVLFRTEDHFGYQTVLDILRQKRPEFFPSVSWSQRREAARAAPKNYSEAATRAAEIRRRAQAPSGIVTTY